MRGPTCLPVRLLVSASVCAFAVAAHAQSKPQDSDTYTIHKKGKIAPVPKQVEALLDGDNASGDWTATTKTAKALAAKADDAMSHVRGASAQIYFVFKTSYGYGYNKGLAAIESPTKFRVQAMHFGGTIRYPQTAQWTTVSDGKMVQSRYGSVTTHAKKVSQSRLPSLSLDDWTVQYQSVLFSGLGTNDRPLSALVARAKAAGLKVETGTRTTSLDSGAQSQNRILITGKALSKGKAARFSIEMVLDDPTGMPLTVHFNRNSVEGNYKSYWTVRWDTRPSQVFPQSLFKLFRS